MIGAGAMDQRITIERKTVTPTISGGRTVTWATHLTVWAAVKSKGGGERLDDGRMNATSVNAFTIYTADVTEADRISWRGELWNIRTIHRSGAQSITMQIDAERGVGVQA